LPAALAAGVGFAALTAAPAEGAAAAADPGMAALPAGVDPLPI